MGRILDLFTGKLFGFKSAKGTDVDLGVSDRLIVTPKSLGESALKNVPMMGTIQFALDGAIQVASTTLSLGSRYVMLADNAAAYFFSSNATRVDARLSVLARADSGSTGEIALANAISGQVIPGSQILINSDTFTRYSSGVFQLDMAQSYSYTMRKLTGGLLAATYLRTALITFSIPKL